VQYVPKAAKKVIQNYKRRQIENKSGENLRARVDQITGALFVSQQ